MSILESGDTRMLLLDADGPILSAPEQANDLIGDAWGQEVTGIAIPVARLDPTFFDLSSLLAGEVIQKLVNYRLRFAILGDISEHLERSGALRDFVWESNRGDHVWFLADEAALAEKLAARAR